MSNLVIGMAQLCSIYNVNFITLAERYEPGVIGDLNANLNSVLGGPLYDVRRDQKDYDEENDLITWNNMNDVPNVLGEMMRSGIHERISYSA